MKKNIYYREKNIYFHENNSQQANSNVNKKAEEQLYLHTAAS